MPRMTSAIRRPASRTTPVNLLLLEEGDFVAADRGCATAA